MSVIQKNYKRQSRNGLILLYYNVLFTLYINFIQLIATFFHFQMMMASATQGSVMKPPTFVSRC